MQTTVAALELNEETHGADLAYAILRALILIGRRPGPPCAKMHPSAGRREDSLAAYLRAKRADRRRVAGARVPTIRTHVSLSFRYA